MVSPAWLVEVVSGLTGVSLPTVVDLDRRLVTAGLRSKGGRGRSAARMTAADAAHLLTAVLASAQSNAAATAVRLYAATTVDVARSSATLFGASGLADLMALAPAHSFVDGLAGLLTSATDGDLAALRRRLALEIAPRIEVYAFTRATFGRIRLSGLPGGMTASLEYRLPSDENSPTGPLRAAGDLEQSRRLSERTIYGVAAVLSREDRDG